MILFLPKCSRKFWAKKESPPMKGEEGWGLSSTFDIWAPDGCGATDNATNVIVY